jgi:hypothetical protein
LTPKILATKVPLMRVKSRLTARRLKARRRLVRKEKRKIPADEVVVVARVLKLMKDTSLKVAKEAVRQLSSQPLFKTRNRRRLKM